MRNKRRVPSITSATYRSVTGPPTHTPARRLGNVTGRHRVLPRVFGRKPESHPYPHVCAPRQKISKATGVFRHSARANIATVWVFLHRASYFLPSGANASYASYAKVIQPRNVTQSAPGLSGFKVLPFRAATAWESWSQCGARKPASRKASFPVPNFRRMALFVLGCMSPCTGESGKLKPPHRKIGHFRYPRPLLVFIVISIFN